MRVRASSWAVSWPARPATARWHRRAGMRWSRPWTCRRGCGSAPIPPPVAATSLAIPTWLPPTGHCATASPVGASPIPLAGAQWWFLPLLDGEDRAIGVAGLYLPGAQARLLPEQRQLAEAMVDDIAQAALRTRLVAELEQAHVSNETERLRSALLGVARPALAIGGDDRVGRQPGQLRCGHGYSRSPCFAGHHPGRGRTAGPLHPEPWT